MSYRVEIRPSAQRDLARLSKQERMRIGSRISALGENPRPSGCVKLSGGTSLWRIRVGDHRVIYQIADEILVVQVVHVGHRRDVYRGI